MSSWLKCARFTLDAKFYWKLTTRGGQMEYEQILNIYICIYWFICILQIHDISFNYLHFTHKLWLKYWVLFLCCKIMRGIINDDSKYLSNIFMMCSCVFAANKFSGCHSIDWVWDKMSLFLSLLLDFEESDHKN